MSQSRRWRVPWYTLPVAGVEGILRQRNPKRGWNNGVLRSRHFFGGVS
jgi:hypothetical protein